MAANPRRPEWMDDPLLLPLSWLWLPAEPLRDVIDARWSLERADAFLFEHEGRQGLRHTFRKLLNDDWIRFDRADALLIRLGIIVSELALEPVCTYNPTRRPQVAPAGA